MRTAIGNLTTNNTLSPPKNEGVFGSSDAGLGRIANYEAYEFPTDRNSYGAWRNSVYEVLVENGYEEEAETFIQCSTDGATFTPSRDIEFSDSTNVKSVYVCGHNHNHDAKAVAFTCHHRFCPDCARRESARVVHRYMPYIKYLLKHKMNGKRRFRKVVLTTKINLRDENAKELTKRCQKAIPRVFDEVWGKGWRKHSGVLCARENGTEGQYLHFHLTVFGGWLPNTRQDGYRLSEVWKRLTDGLGEITDVRAVKDGDVEHDIIETLKYCTKFWKQNDDGTMQYIDPDLIPFLVEQLKGTRRVHTYGIFFKIPTQFLVDHAPVCSTCNAELQRWSVVEWNIYVKTGWTPAEQALYLKLGNNSTSGKHRIRGKPPPEYEQNRLKL